MPVCLVLGASGQIGRLLVPRLLDAGHEVLALSRQPRTSARAGLAWLAGDLNAAMPDLPRVAAILSLGPLDGLAKWLAGAGLAGAPRLIAFGSMSVLAKRDSPDPAERALVARLHAGEQAVIAAADRRGMPWTILRPTLVYGAGLDRSLTPLARLGQRLRVFPVVPGASGLRQPVHAGDLAEACIATLDSAASHGQTYALGGGERLAFSAMLARVRASLGVASVPLPLPIGAARLALPLLRLVRGSSVPGPAAVARLRSDLIADDTPARSDFGWAPRAFMPEVSTWREQPLP